MALILIHIVLLLACVVKYLKNTCPFTPKGNGNYFKKFHKCKICTELEVIMVEYYTKLEVLSIWKLID